MSRTRARKRSAPASARWCELAVLLAEPLHDPHAGDGLVDDAGHLAGPLLRVPRRREHRGAQPEGDRRSSSGIATSATSVSGGDSKSITPSDTTSITRLPSMIGRNGSRPWSSPTSLRRPRHELAGLQLVVAGEVEALEPLVDRVAQVVLHVEATRPPDEAAHVGGAEPEHAGQPPAGRATGPASGRVVER